MNLTKYEQETIILYNNEEKTASVFTYAFEHDFQLLRIPYYEFDEIENRLEVFFKKYA